MPVTNFDPWDQALLTRMIRRRTLVGAENLPSLAERIAPRRDVRARKIKFRVAEVDAFGIGQLRAPDGNPKLYRSSITYRDEQIDLALPDEMERISEDLMLRLRSSDPNIRMSAGVDLVERGRILATRNWRRIEAMRWEAFLTGKVTMPLEDSSAQIDFGLPATHQVTASTLWTDYANADIISQLRAWQKLLADDIGHYGLRVHMNADTWELIYNNERVAEKLSTWGRSLMTVNQEIVTQLLHPGTELIIYNGGYKRDGVRLGGDPLMPNSSRGDKNMVRWLPYGTVLITTEYVIDGENIADTPNGEVLIATGYNSAEPRQGPQSETILHPVSKNTFLRYASAAIPRILLPEAFLVAKVIR